MKKVIKCLVAINKDGKFLGLRESHATTSPFLCEHPYDAKLIIPWRKEEFKDPKPATYYFENSSRMDDWLSGFKMVAIEMEIQATILNTDKQ